MEKKKGFTLIELLAVIVILAVVALIATPLIMVTIGDAKEGALKNTVRNIIYVGETEYMERLMNNTTETPSIAFSELKWKGEKVDSGDISFDEKGKANIAIYKGGLCVYKMSTDNDVTLERNLTEEACLEKLPVPLGSDGCELLSTIDGFENIERTACNTITWDGVETGHKVITSASNMKFVKISEKHFVNNNLNGVPTLLEYTGKTTGNKYYITYNVYVADIANISLLVASYPVETNGMEAGTWFGVNFLPAASTLTPQNTTGESIYLSSLSIPGMNWNS